MYKALIVDDERMIRIGIRMTVPWEGMGITEVFVAASGQEALKIFVKEQPDILITDIRMTEVTGLELIASIRKMNHDLKIIVLTGYDSFDYARECLRMKVDEFLLKPVDEDYLIATVQKLVNSLNEKKQKQVNEKKMRRILGSAEQCSLEGMMNDFILKRPVSEKLLDSLKKDYQYNINAAMRIALLYPAIHSDGKIETDNDSFTMINIKNLLISMVDAQNYGITFENSQGRILIALFAQEQSDGLENIIQDFTELIQEEYNVSTKIFLGSKVEGFAQLYISYTEALLLEDQQKDGYKTVLERRVTKSRLEMFREIYGELKSVMGNNIGNTDKVMRAYEAFCAATDSYNISDSYVRKCCFEVASSVYFSYSVDSGDSSSNKMNSLLNTLVNVGRKEACDITRRFLEDLLSPREQTEHEIISETKRYILLNLAEDISVASIAAKFYITPNYFSRLFKRVTGEGCNEYIVKKRIEQAKSLLETTNIKTGQIAQMVGYHDTNYFSLAFKKHSGVSPTQYRKSIRENG